MKAQMHNISLWIDETNPEILYKRYKELLQECGFHIEGEVEKHFTPHGYTLLFLLSESHFAIHTFPEHNDTYIELSSCVKKQYDNFLRKM